MALHPIDVLHGAENDSEELANFISLCAIVTTAAMDQSRVLVADNEPWTGEALQQAATSVEKRMTRH